MKIACYPIILLLILTTACGPKPPPTGGKTNKQDQQESSTVTSSSQVIIASYSEEKKEQPLVAIIMNRVVGGAEGAFIGNKMDQMANQLEKNFPKADVSRIGEGVLLRLSQESDFYFDDKSGILSDKQTEQLEKLSRVLSIHEQTKIHFINHAYRGNSLQENQKIAQKRVDKIAKQMKKYQINVDRMVLSGKGHTPPSTNSESNQRLEIGIVAGKEMLSSARKNISDR